MPSPRQSLRSSRTRTRGPVVAAPSRTSWIAKTSLPSTPGSRSTSGSARWNPARAGRDPVARMTSSAPAAATSSGPASTPSRTSTPSASRRRPNQPSRSVIWPRDGWRPASRNCPPSDGPRSNKRHVVAALGRDAGRLQPGRPAADDQDGPRGRRRLEPVAAPFELASGRRVDQARDPVVARTPRPAQLVARDARPDLVRPSRPSLRDQVRIGDLAADDADHVGMAGGQHGLGRGGRPDVALGLDLRVPDDRLQRRRERLTEPRLEERGRDRSPRNGSRSPCRT